MPFIGRRARNALEQASLRPQAAQGALLATILRSNRDTSFGKEHGFSEIKDIQAFRSRVPIRSYEEFQPYVDRVVAGEARVLTKEPPVMLATTSGTTGGSKLIPINKSFRRDLGDTSRAWLSGIFDDYPGAFDGYCFMPVSPAIEGVTKSGIPFGSMTGLTYQSAPWLFQRSYAVPYDAMLLENYDLRYYILMRFAVEKNITLALTANPSTWLRLAETGVKYGSAMAQGIQSGNLGPDLDSTFEISERDREILTKIGTVLAPNPSRAAFLTSSITEHGALLPKHIWPGLKILACWLGGSAGIQARWLEDYFGKHVAIRDPGFRASEATMALPFRDGTSAGVLATHVNFYEFIPEAHVDDDDPPVLQAHELEIGETYSIILTTRGGLYRYKINDIIEVEGFYKQCPLVSFLRKGRDVVNLTGEKLHVTQVMGALAEAEDATSLSIYCYCLIPEVNAMRYDLLVELEDSQSEDALKIFLKAFDSTLSQLNEEYRTKRASGRLHAPRLIVMQSGWSDREKRRQVAAGKRDVQYKWPLLQQAWKSEYDTEVIKTQDLPA